MNFDDDGGDMAAAFNDTFELSTACDLDNTTMITVNVMVIVSDVDDVVIFDSVRCCRVRSLICVWYHSL